MSKNLVKRKMFFLFLMLAYGNFVCGQQTVLEDSPFKTEIVNFKTLSDIQLRTNLRTGRECKLVRVRIRLKSEAGKKECFDPNPLSLILDSFKQRIRPSSFEYPVVRFGNGVNRMLMEDDRKITRWAGYKYDPSIKDSFEDYAYMDYENITYPLNWHYLGYKTVFQYYFQIKCFKKRKADIIFVVPENAISGSLYYGNQKIEDLRFE